MSDRMVTAATGVINNKDILNVSYEPFQGEHSQWLTYLNFMIRTESSGRYNEVTNTETHQGFPL